MNNSTLTEARLLDNVQLLDEARLLDNVQLMSDFGMIWD
jgi:hypothetical protein